MRLLLSYASLYVALVLWASRDRHGSVLGSRPAHSSSVRISKENCCANGFKIPSSTQKPPKNSLAAYGKTINASCLSLSSQPFVCCARREPNSVVQKHSTQIRKSGGVRLELLYTLDVLTVSIPLPKLSSSCCTVAIAPHRFDDYNLQTHYRTTAQTYGRRTVRAVNLRRQHGANADIDRHPFCCGRNRCLRRGQRTARLSPRSQVRRCRWCAHTCNSRRWCAHT